MIDLAKAARANEDSPVKEKPYKSPMMVEIGKTSDIVQSYYVYNPNDGYQGYYTYRS